MIFLRNNEIYQKVGLLRSVDASLLEEQDRSIMDRYEGARIQGAYSYLSGGELLAIIRFDDDLLLRVNSEVIIWNDILSVDLKDIPDGKRRLEIKAKSKQVFIDYIRPVIEPPLSSVFEPFSEEEDFDFGLFVKHFADYPGRRERAFSG